MPLRVVEACAVDWDSLVGDGDVRRCAACDKDVHDLADHSDVDAFAWALVHGGSSFCARLPAPRPALRGRSPLAAVTLGALAACASAPEPRVEPTVEPPVAVVAPPADAVDEVTPAPAVDVVSAPLTPAVPVAAPRPAVVVKTMGLVIQPRIDFARNSAKPDKASWVVIEEAANVLRDHAEITSLRVRGNASSDEVNPDGLSLQRARSVIAALVAQGIAADRLVPVGDGTTRPIAPNNTPLGRAQNRRVTFEVEPTSCPAPADSEAAPSNQ